MNPLIISVILNVILPLLLIVFLLIIKILLNRFVPFSRTHFLYIIFSLSSGFLLFLLITPIQVKLPVREVGYATFTFFFLILFTKCLNIWLKDSYIPRHKGMHIPFLLIDIIRWLIVIGLLFAILKVYFNINLTGIFATSAVATAIIGFSLQDILKNFFAGIALNFETPFKRGDWIEIAGNRGEVIGMSWRATKIKTIEGNYIIIPNANISQENIVNYSVPRKTLARYVNVSVHYRFPPKLVKDVIKEAVLSTEGVLKTPEPITRLVKFNESSMDYECKFWLSDYPNLFNIEDAVKSKIWYFFAENEIEIPFPIRTVYTYKGKKKAVKDTRDIVELLTEIEIFSPLTRKELNTLSRKFILGFFSRGEKLIEQGEQGSTFFIVKHGNVSVNTIVEDRMRKIKSLSKGDFFGEMSLLTGEKRTATIIAEEETEVLILDRDDFAHILKKKPQIADRISKILVQRKTELTEKTTSAKSRKREQKKIQEKSILGKIRKVFELKRRGK